jgi:glycosyltransferase involved in cell wall biosynthesis
VIAVVVPAHDEETHIAACIASLLCAARCPLLMGEKVIVVIVLDACSDATGDIARGLDAVTVAADTRNVGAARALGAELALDMGARWLAFTDADTEVDAGWLSAQMGLECDAVCGTVAVRHWDVYGEQMRLHHDATYCDVDGHRHIHGANLGVSADAYRSAGGFRPLASSEDVALVESLQRIGRHIEWSTAPRVFTSARTNYKAPDGFGATLERLHRSHGLLAAESSP